MSKPRRKYRTLAAGHRGKREPEHTQELVLTLSIPDGEVVNIEMLDKSGQRKELSEEELADLAGDDDIAPEEVYAAAIAGPNEEDEFDLNDDEAIERLILREMIAHQLFRRGMRRFIVQSGRKREGVRQQPSTRKVAQKAGSKAHNNGHERSKTGG